MSSVKLNEEEKRLLHNAWHHFLTITHHKLVVMEGCFKVGLLNRGLLHDLSKYSWEEFKTGVKYYQGTRSPNAAEKEEKGYSSRNGSITRGEISITSSTGPMCPQRRTTGRSSA